MSTLYEQLSARINRDGNEEALRPTYYGKIISFTNQS